MNENNPFFMYSVILSAAKERTNILEVVASKENNVQNFGRKLFNYGVSFNFQYKLDILERSLLRKFDKFSFICPFVKTSHCQQ